MTRLAAVAGALIVCAWFALGVRQSTTLNHAESILGTTPNTLPAATAARVQSLLNEAGTLNPDRQVDLERSQLQLDAGHTLAARADAASVTLAEPQNLEAWVALARTAATDPSLFRLTLRRIGELEPRRP